MNSLVWYIFKNSSKYSRPEVDSNFSMVCEFVEFSSSAAAVVNTFRCVDAIEGFRSWPSFRRSKSTKNCVVTQQTVHFRARRSCRST